MKKAFSILLTCLLCLVFSVVAQTLSIQEKVEGRNFPSICSMVTINYNLPLHVSANENTAYHDIMWAYLYALKFSRVDGRIQLVGNPEITAIHDPGGDPIKNSVREHEGIRSYNPNLVFMVPLPTRAVGTRSFHYRDLFGEIPWLRDTAGNFISGKDQGPSNRIDFSHPHYIDMLVEMAVAVDNHEFYDGVIFDSFGLGANILPHLTLAEEEGVRIEILRRIREAVSDNFLILASGYDSNAKILAPYINGIYMESYRAKDYDYKLQGLKKIEQSLFWAENSLQAPLINCLEAEGIAQESPKSPRNQQWMRLFTTLSLTHSDGYVVYTMGVQSEPHQHDAEFQHPHPHVNHLTDTNFGHGNDPLGVNHGHSHHHYWYDFYDAELGRPMGEKAQLYENQEGLFIREFTNGWAVYNRSGKGQIIKLPAKSSGVESGITAIEHTIPDLDGEIFLKAPVMVADLNGDEVVNVLDLVIVAGAFGVENASHADVNADGMVNILDLVSVAQEMQ